MSYLTRYGGYYGLLPETTGNIYWVAPAASYTIYGPLGGRSYVASNGNDGLSPERAVLTLNYAISLCTANVGDAIVLLPGAHSYSATATANVAGITITGVPGGFPLSQSRMNGGGARQRSTVTTTETSGIIITVTAADVEIAYLHFITVAGGSGISASNAADRLYVHDCTWNMSTAANTATFGVTFPLGTGTTTINDDSVIRNCYFYVSDNQGPAIRAAGTVAGLNIENCTFELAGDTAWDDAIEVTLSGSVGIKIRDCDFLQRVSGTAIGDCIEVTGVTTDGATQIYRCYAPAGSDLVEATATADAYAAECYLATTTGGALTGSV